MAKDMFEPTTEELQRGLRYAAEILGDMDGLHEKVHKRASAVAHALLYHEAGTEELQQELQRGLRYAAEILGDVDGLHEKVHKKVDWFESTVQQQADEIERLRKEKKELCEAITWLKRVAGWITD